MILPVVEIGSLPRPNWAVGRKSERFFRDAEYRGKVTEAFYRDCQRYEADPRFPFVQPTAEELMHGTALTTDDAGSGLRPASERAAIETFAGYVSVLALAKAGLDEVYNGEQTRKEMSEAALERISGFESVGIVPAFWHGRGWASYKLFACRGEPRIERPYHQEERVFVQQVARGLGKQEKVIETGAVPLTIWNADVFYYPKEVERYGHGKRAEYEGRRGLIRALDENVIIPVMRAHREGGAARMTIDLSRVSQNPEQLPLVIESIGRMNDQIGGEFGLHFCFDDYLAIATAQAPDRRRLGDMESVNRLYIESANGEDARGSDGSVLWHNIRGLRHHGYQGAIAPGFVNVHSPEIESVELLVQRIRKAIEADHGHPERIVVNPDCGLRTRTWDVAFAKLRNLAEAAAVVREKYRLA